MSAFDDSTGVSENGGVRVTESVVEGMDEDVDVLDIERLETFKTSALDGSGPVRHEQWRKSTHLRKQDGFEVLEALADYYGYRIEPK